MPLDITKVKEFLAGLGTNAGNAQTAADNAPAIGSYLLNYIMGSSPTSADGFDGLVAALMSKWSGDAADAFKKQTQTLRSFGIAVAALADKMVNTQPTGQQLPALMQYELGSRADYTGAASTVYQLFTDAHGKYVAATGSPNDFDHWTRHLTDLIRNTAADISQRTFWSMEGTETVNAPTFEEFVDGKQGSGAGVLTVEYSCSQPLDPGTSKVSYQNPQNGAAFHLTVQWNEWPWQNDQIDNSNQDSIRDQTRDVEYDGYLQKVMTDLGNQYPTVQAPQQQDNSVLPKTDGSGHGNPPYGPPGGGYGGSGFGGGVPSGTVPGGPVPGLGPGLPGNGAAVSGSAVPGSAVPAGAGQLAGIPAAATGAGGPGPLAGGALDPTRLAGFNPGGGLAPGATGFGGGVPGLAGAGGLGPGGALAGGGLAGGADAAGLSGAGAAGAGAAGRMMPMAPMAGAGAGQAKGERPRTAFLTEDEEVWGADRGGEPVL